MTTAAEMAASKLAQENEAENRRKLQEAQGGALDPNEREAADLNDPIEGDDLGGNPPREPREPEEREPTRRERQMSPGDRARAEMAARFKRPDEQPFSGDMNDQEALFGDVARVELEPDPDAPEPGVPLQQEQQPAPKMFTIKVRGKDVQLTEAQLIERASKVEAADSYLDETRDLLKQAQEVRRGRSRQDGHHQADENGAADDELENQDEPDRAQQHPAAKLKEAVEKIQFSSDPEEAARILGEAIDDATNQATDRRQLERLVNNDRTKAQHALREFAAKPENKAIGDDEDAAVLMEKNIYRIYREDIVKLGVVAEDKIPTDPKQLADWHRFYKVSGHEVRDTGSILTEARSRVLKKMPHLAPATTSERTARPRAENRVDVNVDRTQRRQAIPNNPSRSVAPRSDQQQRAPAQQQSRSDVVAQMRRQRGQPVA